MKKTIKLLFLLLAILAGLNSADFVLGKTLINYDDAEIINKEVKEINNEIQDNKNRINKIQDQQKQYSEEIKKKQAEKASLANQLAIMDNRLAKSELDIELVETEIERTKLEIQKTDIEIKNKNEDIETEKTHIANVLRLMDKRDRVSTLEILLLNDSLSDFLSQVKYLEDISTGVKDSLDTLEKLKRQLENQKRGLDKQNQELAKLKTELTEKKEQMESEKESKAVVLSQVSSSEKEYQRLLAQAKKEQEEVAAEIASMEKLVRAKIAALQGDKLEFNDNGFIWPVTKNVITAYFHDPDYPFRNIFEHPAIDIRAGQGTALKAAASGYVARVKTGGATGYGYIMLIHGDGLSTVYGHVSKIYVGEDEYVVQGQTIGLSGGLPGTPGAGSLTTGPHLHFEVRLNGIPVDPLSYLP